MIKYTGKSFKQKSIIWNITDICNYKCSYCQSANNKTQKIVPDLIENINKIENGIIFLYGGEPTLFNGYEYILDNIKISKGLYSNMSKDLTCLQDSNISKIICSFHYSQQSKEKFLENISKIEDKIFFTINVMLENEHHKEIVDFYKELVKRYGSRRVSLRLIIQKNYYDSIDILKYKDYLSSYDYFCNNKRIIFDGNLFSQINTKGFECDICQYMVFLSNDGTISPSCNQISKNIKDINKLRKIICKGTCSIPQILIGSKRKI